ncbi:MAG: hypothetical protein HQL77_18920 [Magnetococcales bacterium]|nr:hypothetical protein [Magnetococcales bacterium]
MSIVNIVIFILLFFCVGFSSDAGIQVYFPKHVAIQKGRKIGGYFQYFDQNDENIKLEMGGCIEDYYEKSPETDAVRVYYTCVPKKDGVLKGIIEGGTSKKLKNFMIIAKNVKPAVTDIFPRTVLANQPVTFTVKGSNLDSRFLWSMEGCGEGHLEWPQPDGVHHLDTGKDHWTFSCTPEKTGLIDVVFRNSMGTRNAPLEIVNVTVVSEMTMSGITPNTVYTSVQIPTTLTLHGTNLIDGLTADISGTDGLLGIPLEGRSMTSKTLTADFRKFHPYPHSVTIKYGEIAIGKTLLYVGNGDVVDYYRAPAISTGFCGNGTLPMNKNVMQSNFKEGHSVCYEVRNFDTVPVWLSLSFAEARYDPKKHEVPGLCGRRTDMIARWEDNQSDTLETWIRPGETIRKNILFMPTAHAWATMKARKNRAFCVILLAGIATPVPGKLSTQTRKIVIIRHMDS